MAAQKMTPDATRQPCNVCLECGHEQTVFMPCRECGSRLVVSVYFMQQQYGEGWRELLRDKSETVN
jgi:primosomal protein N'